MQRKVFRVERLFADAHAAPPESGEREAIDQATVSHELALVRETLARNRQELSLLIGERKAPRMARAAGELGAAAEGMEKATHRILQAAEIIDDSAKSLGAALKSEFERGLAQDIQEHAVHIYEACNFQDLAGQRIAKVISMLTMIEEQLAGMVARCGTPPCTTTATPAENGGLLNGPKLDGDPGHASQGDVDALFN